MAETRHITRYGKTPTVRDTYCCGLDELYGLSGATAEDVKDALDTWADTNSAPDDYDVKPKHVAIFATTIPKQRAGRALRANGFRIVKKFRNPNSGNLVSLWFRKPDRG